MDEFHFADIFATKGIEYLVVVGYMALLIFFWRFLISLGEKESGDKISQEVKSESGK